MHQLVTIKLSHYNEKARWALERFSVPYEERGYMPMLHMVGVLPIALRYRKGKMDKVSSPLSTPVLVTEGGLCLHDSSEIVRWASDHHAPAGFDLYPTRRVAELEQRFALGLGPHSRRIGYYHLFGAPELLDDLADVNVGRTQARLFRLIRPLGQKLITKSLKINEPAATRSLDFCRKEVADLAGLLDGREYLEAGRFTAADLALACMMAPLLLPSPEEGYGGVFPAIDACPPAFAALVREMRETVAGKHALRMFRHERGPLAQRRSQPEAVA